MHELLKEPIVSDLEKEVRKYVHFNLTETYRKKILEQESHGFRFDYIIKDNTLGNVSDNVYNVILILYKEHITISHAFDRNREGFVLNRDINYLSADYDFINRSFFRSIEKLLLNILPGL